MACTLFRFTLQEALADVTLHAARALCIAHAVGSLAMGKLAALRYGKSSDREILPMPSEVILADA